jgi:tRNA(Ile)-lysidine synthase
VRLPAGLLHPATVAWANARPSRERWAVAFSGGADSIALLLLLFSNWPSRRGRLCALHFDHRLRGAASRADAVFCRRVCRALGVEFAGGAWKRGPRKVSEAEARAARFAFFEKEMRSRRIRVLWMGHQRDDVAETLLMRLARGSGAGGLAAPRPVQVGSQGRIHLRPLLELRKAEITQALRAAGVPWREDSTNAGSGYFRNRIRNAVIPAWSKAAGRDALAGAARTRELLEEDDSALELMVDRLKPVTPAGKLDVRRLQEQPRAIARRALHRWLLRLSEAGGLSRQGFDALLGAVQRGSPTRQSLGSNGFARIRGKWLIFERKRAAKGPARPPF